MSMPRVEVLAAAFRGRKTSDGPKDDDPREIYFDAAFYLRRHGVDADAFRHYREEGWKAGFMPNPLFCPVHYAEAHGLGPDEEPLAHFVEQGDTPGFTSPAFDAAGYLRLYPHVALSGDEPLHHFLTVGVRQGYAPGFALYELAERKEAFPDFDWESAGAFLNFDVLAIGSQEAEAYRSLIDPVYYTAFYQHQLNGLSPEEHYAVHGARRGNRANPFFDAAWYARRHGLRFADPLWDHILTGRQPAPFFCAKSYLRANPAVGSLRAAFAHFVAGGEGGRCDLGLNGEQLTILRKASPDYHWDEAGGHYAFPFQARAVGGLTPSGGVSLPPRRMEADRFHLDAILNRSRQKKLISFDIWDTLLRRVCDPDMVKFHAAAVLQNVMRQYAPSHELSVADLYRLRQLAEYRVADEHYEYRHETMMWDWIALAGVPATEKVDAIIREVAEAELAREMEVTWVDPTAIALLESLGDKRIVAISDFYLSGRQLSKILAHHGLDRYFQGVYVSSDLLKTKRAGDLLDHVCEAEGCDVGDWLHIGDNRHADYEVPIGRGVDAYHFVDDLEMQRKICFQREFEAVLSGDGSSFEPQILKLRDVEEEERALAAQLRQELSAFDPLSDISSVGLLASIFAGFGRFILERAQEAGADTIYFATREGLFFKEVCELLAHGDILRSDSYPAFRMLEVSRRATFAASLRSASIQEMMRLWSLYSIQSMQAFARTLNLDEDRMSDFCTAAGISFEEKIVYPWKNERVIALFADGVFVDWLKAAIAQQRAALWEYLQGIGFDPGAAKNRFMVDIGWRGSIQDNLAFIVNGRLDGAYMALYRYLAEQPANAAKHGFLLDLNKTPDDQFHVGDFAALEFISNGPGGSVTGYAGGRAQRQTIASEEALMEQRILPMQARILSAIKDLLPVLRGTSLSAGSWREVARRAVRRYTERPDEEISSIFLELEHNETFGVGEIQDMRSDDDGELESLAGAAFNSAVRNELDQRRWYQTWLYGGPGRKLLSNLSVDQKLNAPRLQGIVKAPALIRSLGYRVSIFAPEPIRGSGGHRTIYNFAKALDVAGFNVDLFSERRGSQYAYIEQELAGHPIRMHEQWFSGIIPEAAVATVNYSSSYISKSFSDRVKKFYFVQDFEAAFNPVSDGYIRGENSFAEGHSHLCVGRWLPHVLRTQFGSGAMGSGLGIDPRIYRPLDDVERTDRIAVLFQPEKWRRLPEHCLEALTIVKARRPQTEIVFYGSAERPAAPFQNVHLGLVDDLAQLNRLYNSARIGLCISLTNPSRIPYEMMAAGCVPVDVYRYNNLFDYDSGTSLLAYQSAASLAAAMLHLLDDRNECDARRRSCIATAKGRTLAWEMDGAVNALEYVLNGGSLGDLAVPEPSYTDPPFIAGPDDRPAVRAWCAAQARMAGMD
nr:HAD-IA family hydrolase [Sphingomonas sp.]